MTHCHSATFAAHCPPSILLSRVLQSSHVIAAASSPLNMENPPLILHSSPETGHSHLIRHMDNESQSRAQLKIATNRCPSKAHAPFAWLLSSIQTLGIDDTLLIGMPCASLWLRVLPNHPPAQKREKIPLLIPYPFSHPHPALYTRVFQD